MIEDKERLQAGLQVHQLTSDISKQLMDFYSTVIPKVEKEIKK